MKVAKEAGEEYDDSTRNDNILGSSKTRWAIWQEHLQRSNYCAGQSHEMSGKFELGVWVPSNGGRVSRDGGRWFPPKFEGKVNLVVRLASLGSDG